MSLETIDHPEVNRVYLLRRKVGGNAKSRFEPARILDVQRANNLKVGKFYFNGDALKVFWLYDQVIEENFPALDGFVKAYSTVWFHEEGLRIKAEAEYVKRVYNVLDYLQFKPNVLTEPGVWG